MKRQSVPVLVVLALVALSAPAFAQEFPAPEFPAQRFPPPQIGPSGAAAQVWSADQLNNLVAPVALYPDPLLGQILVAATYPLEVVEANQWLEQNRNLSGQALIDAAKQQPWDPSVQALVAVPDALAKLNQDIRWTTDLGNAFLAQQADVMSAVQTMRQRAQGNGRLVSTPQQTVSSQYQGGQQVIEIQPTSPEVIYVPVYDPVYVWGPPVYGYYPRLNYSYWGFGFGPAWHFGAFFGGWGGFGWGWDSWGWCPSWYGRHVFVNPVFFNHYGFRHNYYGGGWGGGRTIWAHDPGHRLGIGYGNRAVESRFQSASIASRNNYRSSFSNSANNGHAYQSSPALQRYQQNFMTRNFDRGANSQPAQQFRPQAQYDQQYRAPQAQYNQQYRAPQTQSNQVYHAPQPQYSPGYRSAPQMQYSPAPSIHYSAPGGGGGSHGGGGGHPGGGGGNRGGGSHGGGHRG